MDGKGEQFRPLFAASFIASSSFDFDGPGIAKGIKDALCENPKSGKVAKDADVRIHS
jgi:hypothetical protein